jgi:TonB family protein
MKRFKNRPRYSIALITSLFIHVALFSYVFKTHESVENFSTPHFAKNSMPTIQLDSVKIITPKQLQQIKDNQRKQIVANELNGKKERPVDSKFAGEADQTFDRQTIAARNGSFKSAGLGNKLGNESAQSQAASVPQAPKKIAAAKKMNQSPPKNLSLSDLGTIQISKIEDEEKAKSDALEEASRKLASESKKSSALGIEKGNAESHGLAQNNDFVEEVPLGDMTNLNTTEFKYYGFYHRIRQKLEQHWGNTIQSKARNLYKSGRRMPASENLITAVQVVLDDHGHIVEIKIEGTSGIRELDQAAIESFNKAGPFPNPPKGLLVDGRAVIQWGFVVKS